jgi:hypothetical protein
MSFLIESTEEEGDDVAAFTLKLRTAPDYVKHRNGWIEEKGEASGWKQCNLE